MDRGGKVESGTETEGVAGSQNRGVNIYPCAAGTSHFFSGSLVPHQYVCEQMLPGFFDAPPDSLYLAAFYHSK